MGDTDAANIHDSSDAGIAADHPSVAPFRILAGPATANESNLVRMRLIPIACWRVEDVRFEFDSSFVLPTVRDEMRILASLIRAHTKALPPPISIFGHADPTGKDDYNKFLSGRRAAAVYGMLTRREEIWEDLFSNHGVFAKPVAGDKWDTKVVRAMLTELSGPLPIEGKTGDETENAIKEFQKKNGLPADGKAGPATRQKLFRAYMDQVCVDKDGKPFQVDRTEGFLARDQDPGGKGDFQGCGEFNPVLIFSAKDNATFEQDEDKSDRNDANASNRRVMALLFRPGSRISSARWPCPRAKEGTAGCIKRFFSDGEKRRSSRLLDEPRTHEDTADTFACRFYQRLTSDSPCERLFGVLRIRLYDGFGQFIPLAPFSASAAETPSKEELGRADARGIIALRDIRTPSQQTIRWGFPPESGEAPELIFSRTVFLIPDSDRTPEASMKRLKNLGYDGPDDSDNIVGFQLDYGFLVDPPLKATGVFDDRTRALVEQVHRQSADTLRDTTSA